VKLVYVGHASAPVEVPDAGVVCEAGEPVDIPVKIARRLLEQSVWQRAPKSAKE